MQNAYTGQTAPLSPLDFAAPDLAAQQRQLARQQQLAELLRAQALQPQGGTEMVGGWAIPNSPVKPLEKLAQALMARHVQGQADEQETSLAQSRGQALAQALSGGNGGPDVNRGLMLQAFGAPPEVVTAAMLGGKNKTMTVDTGNGTQLVAVPERGTAAPVNLGSFGKSASPDAVLGSGTTLEVAGMRDATDRRGQDMSRATSLEATGMNNATSVANNSATNATTLAAAEARLKLQERMNSPEFKAKVATAVSQAEAKAKKESNGNGANTLLEEADGLLQGIDRTKPTGKPGQYEAVPKPTGSGFGAAVDYGASLIGQSFGSAETADRLSVIGGALTLKMPRMEGPQSDADRRLYIEMAGQVGDRTVPAERRRAALQTVRQIMSKYDGGGQALAPSGNAQAGGTIKWGDMK